MPGSSAGDLALESLGAVAEARELGAVARGTHAGDGFVIVADAAAQPVAAGEVGERDVALGTGPRMATVVAGQQRGVAAAVEEEDDLLARFDRGRHRLRESR